jgi:hypothetical protein
MNNCDHGTLFSAVPPRSLHPSRTPGYIRRVGGSRLHLHLWGCTFHFSQKVLLQLLQRRKFCSKKYLCLISGIALIVIGAHVLKSMIL